MAHPDTVPADTHFPLPLWKLSFDILDCVIQELADREDVETLKTCALVCKALTTLCQRRIFNEIELANYVSKEPSSHTLATFKRLSDRNPKIPNYVRSLVYEHDVVSWLPGGPDPDILLRLRRLDKLDIRFYPQSDPTRMQWWYSASLTFRCAFISLIRFNDITALYIDNISNFPATLFSYLPSLVFLQLDETALDFTLRSSVPTSTIPKILSLVLGDCAGNMIDAFSLPQQIAFLDFADLKDLSMSVNMDTPEKDMRVFSNLLRTSRRLNSIVMEGSAPDMNFDIGFAEIHPESLHTLNRIQLEYELWEESQHPFCHFTGALERMIGANSIQEVDFLIAIPHNFLCCSMDLSLWSLLDHVLSTKEDGFPALRQLRVAISVFYDESTLAEAQEMFDKLEAICDSAFSWLKAATKINFVLLLKLRPEGEMGVSLF